MFARRDHHDFTLVSQGNTFPPPTDYCTGCGYHPVVYSGEHRADCTAVPKPAEYCDQCLYYPVVHHRHRADCTAARKEVVA